MAYKISSLSTYNKICPKYNKRTEKISKITIHHWCGVVTAKKGVDYMCSDNGRQVSCNYVVGNDGSIGCNIPEDFRSWCSSSNWNDQRAITIECSNSKCSGDYPISDAAMRSLIKLCADICKRNGIKKLYYDGTKNGTLTRHCFYSNTDCPGTYIKNHTQYICDEVNKILGVIPANSKNTKTYNPYKKPTMILNKNNAAYGKKYAGRSEVKWIHYELTRLKLYSGDIDGYFGPMTVSAVKSFQKTHKDTKGRKLEVDGSVGPLTREALAKATK